MKSKIPRGISGVALGKFGEEKATEHLISNGYMILCRNFRCRSGEIDIIARDMNKGGMTVFFEVKTRKSLSFGLPCEALTPLKIRRIRKVIEVYTVSGPGAVGDFRVDTIEILMINEKIYIRHLENILP